jgi:hypothetical protein
VQPQSLARADVLRVVAPVRRPAIKPVILRM